MYNAFMKKPRVCIIHDILVQYGGAERTVEAMAEIFPDAPIYTYVYKEEVFKDTIIGKRKVVVFSDSADKVFKIIPIFTKYFTFLLPALFESIDLSEFDIVITSSSSYAKGVVTKPEQLHVSYIHTPPRFLYGFTVESTKRNAWYYKPVVAFVDHYLRIWDYLAAQRADFVVTNCHNTLNRIRKFYRRDAKVIYPPVDVNYDGARYRKNNLEKPYYLAIGRIVAYKNFDLLVQAFNLLGLRLKVIGTGLEEKNLRRMAKGNIEFLGRVSDEVKHEQLEFCMGLIFPVEEEDFGIVPIEAMAHGKPVLAHRSGGVLETVREGIDGMFFDSLELSDFVESVKEFDKGVREDKYNSNEIRRRVKDFSKVRFKKEFKNFVLEKWSVSA